MPDQLRFNAHKPGMGYLLVMSTSTVCMLWNVPSSEARDVIEALCNFATNQGRALIVEHALCELMRVNELDPALELVKTYEYGATKYKRGNYLLGAPMSQYLNCAARHLHAYWVLGELVDKESGCSHLAHAFWNVERASMQEDFRDDRLYVENPRLGLVDAPVPESVKTVAFEFTRCGVCGALQVRAKQTCFVCDNSLKEKVKTNE